MNKNDENSHEFFERFLSPSERGKATHDLAILENAAIPILESLFSGSAKNKFGIAYKLIGALDCGYVAASLLGKAAKPLEAYIREGIENDHRYAIEAAGSLENLEEETALALAEALVRDPFGSEAQYSLVLCGQNRNPKILSIVKRNHKATYSLEQAEKYSKTLHLRTQNAFRINGYDLNNVEKDIQQEIKSLKLAIGICVAAFIVVLAIASVPLKMGLENWLKFKTPDNIGFGLGFGFLALFGLPVVIAIIHLVSKLKGVQAEQGHNITNE